MHVNPMRTKLVHAAMAQVHPCGLVACAILLTQGAVLFPAAPQRKSQALSKWKCSLWPIGSFCPPRSAQELPEHPRVPG